MREIKRQLLILICICGSSITFGQNSSIKPYAKDVSSVQNILTAYYDCISGPIGEKRDFTRLKNLFDPNARLIYSHWNQESTKASNLIFKTVDEFVERLGYLDKKGFYEHEVSNEIHTFSSVTQVFSTYKFRVEDKSIPDGRGITSYEIFYDGERYWILSMLWVAENDRFKIPEKYLEEGAVEKKISNLIEKLDDALVNRDFETLNAFYSSKMKLVAPNGTILSKEMSLTPFKDPNRKSGLYKVENEDVQITVHNDYVSAVMKTTHFMNGSKNRTYKNVQVFGKENGTWKLELITSILLSN